MDIFDLDIIDAFRDTLENAKNIVIVGHKNADGDCLGSAFAASSFFKNKNINTQIIIPNEIASFFNWIPETSDILIYENEPWNAVNYISKADVIFMVDFSDFSRIDDLADSIEIASALKIVIDHHRDAKEIGDFSFVDIHSSSAAELIFNFLKIIDTEIIDKKIAEFIYMGISSDTGNFMFDSATSKTFATVSELLNYNIDKSKIVAGLYNNYPIERLHFMGYLLNKKLVILDKYNTAFTTVSLKEKEEYNFKTGMLEHFVNLPLAAAKIKLSIIFTEAEDEIHISLRSKGNLNVSKISNKYFKGGGHKNAAGGKINLNINDIPQFMEQNIEEIIKIGNETE